MRILIYRLGSLGDTVVALPCFRLIRRTHPTAHITVLTNAPVSGKAAPLESILKPSGLIDDVIPYPIGLRDPQRLARLISLLREQKFDLMISLTASRGWAASVRDTLFFKACGISMRIGIPFEQRDLVCQRLPDSKLFESETTRLLRRVRSLGTADPNEPAYFDLGLTAEEIGEAGRVLAGAGIAGKFIAASLGTKSPLKDWGTENWKQLLPVLGREQPGAALILLGSADESERSAALLESWPGPHANLCGRLAPRISAALLQKASLFIGHDSGPMHLADAVGTRCVTIYSAQAPPGQWFPSGEGHVNLYPYSFYDPKLTHDPDHQRRAISSIGVDEVLAATRPCLA
jgi:heptosyltransferase-3